MSSNKKSGPKILFLDIETTPILAWVWGLFDQNVGLEQIKEDWRIMSFAAVWEDSNDVIQVDLRNGLNDKNEKAMLTKIWHLLDEAEIVVGQNSKKFDVKKLNEKFLHYGLGKPSPFQQEDTLVLSKKHFAATSHKLEYRSKQLNTKYKKMSHSKYPGFLLWKACMAGDQKAWQEMSTYNIFDVLSTREYFNTLRPWGTTVNFSVYNESDTPQCQCGNTKLQRRGFNYSNAGKYQRFQCKCGAWLSGKTNLLSQEKRKSLLK
jgi:hypothetical protein